MTLNQIDHNLPITQAVIFAGGEGKRLRPMTENRPKPMIEINGKVFLEYLIEQLKEQGFTKVLLLLGYLPEIIQDYFQDGEKWGIQIEYFITPVECETGYRIQQAKTKLDPYFLLMYCDNYWPLNIEPMWRQYQESGASMLLTVYSNKDHYTKNNVKIGSDGFIQIYDKDRSQLDLNGVEIGYALVKRSLIDLFTFDKNEKFQHSLYPRLIESRQMVAYYTNHRYYSIGGLERLPLTEEFFSQSPTVILDRDGVLNRKAPKACYIENWEQFQWQPYAFESLRLFNQAGFRVIVITNQAGIHFGVMTEDDLLDIHNRMKQDVEESGGKIHEIYHCPHGWDDGCDCRKPNPGMIFQAQQDYNLDLSRTYFVGDDDRDRQAAEAAGCPFFMVSQDQMLLDFTKQLIQQNISALV